MTKQPKLRLWLSPGACSLAPHAILAESGLSYEILVVDITKNASGFPKEYLHINPKGRIPILEYDDEILTETTAIMTLVSHLAPEKHLFGRTSLETAQVYEWLNWLSGTVHERGLGGFFGPNNYSDDPDALNGIRKKSWEWLNHCWGLIEQKLEARDRAVGEVFTAADVFLWVVYRWGYLLRVDMEKVYPNWTRVVNGVTSRDAVKAAVEKEGIPMVKDNRLEGVDIGFDFEANRDG